MADLHIEIVALQHQMWRTRLRSFLDGRETITSNEAVSYRDCELGKWMYSEGKQQYGDKTVFVELERLHADFHDRVKDVVALKNQGKLDEAEDVFRDVKALSDKVGDLLDQLGEMLK